MGMLITYLPVFFTTSWNYIILATCTVLTCTVLDLWFILQLTLYSVYCARGCCGSYNRWCQVDTSHMKHTIPIAVLLRKSIKHCKFPLPVFAASLISKLMVMPDSMKVFVYLYGSVRLPLMKLTQFH